MNRKALTFSLLVLLLPLGIARAADSGVFIGGSVGQATLDLPAIAGLDLDDGNTAWKLILGYVFEFGPINLGVEGGYVDLGGPSLGDSRASADIESSGFGGFGVAGIEIGPIDLFAKVGAISWDVEARISGSAIDDAILVNGSHSGTDVAVGVGAGFNLNTVGIRAEYERYEIDIPGSDSIDMWSLGVVYRF
jgi:outer membrane immunogenic protein